MATEKRLIDANALIENRDIHIVIGAGDNICIDIADIAKAPTVDAVEVVHGRWLYDGGSFCSVCGEYAISQLHRDCDGSEYYEDYLTNHCPNCGAKMDGDGNG